METQPNIISNPVIKFSKEVSDFIEACGSRSDDYYWFNYYFKKVGDCLFEMVVFKDLPDGLKHIVERSEPKGPDQEDEE